MLALLFNDRAASKIMEACLESTELERDRNPRWSINEVDKTVSRDGITTRLTQTEFALFVMLLDAGGRSVSKHELIREVWGGDSMATPEALKERIKTLRRKIGTSEIVSEYGYGYRLSNQ